MTETLKQFIWKASEQSFFENIYPETIRAAPGNQGPFPSFFFGMH